MADNNQDPKKLAEENNLLRQQNNLLEQRLKIQEEGYSVSTAYLESLKEALGIQTRLSQRESDTLDINKKLQKAIKDQNTELNSVVQKTKEISKNNDLIAKANLTIRGLENSITEERKKQVDKTSRAVQLQNNLVKEIEEELKKVEQGEQLNQAKLTGLKEQLAAVEKEVERRTELLDPLERQLLYTKLVSDELKNQNLEREKEKELLDEIEEKLGVAGKLSNLIGKIPGLGNASAKALQKVTKEMKEAADAGKQLPTKMQTLKAIAKETGKGLLADLKDPLTLITMGVTALVKSFLSSDKSTTELQKNLTISKGEALLLNAQFSAAALSLDDMFITSRDMTKSFGVLQEKLGSVGKVTTESANTFARLNKLVGLTEQEAGGLQAQYAAFGKDSDEVYKSQLRTTHQVSQQYKTQINQKAVLAEVGKASAYTLVQFRGSTQALTEAVAKSKALGISMETLGKVSSGLLDFQSSIENELAAELLTGKQINLEQARYYALTNQQSKLMDELNSQIGTFSDFTNMTAVQQEAYAKSLGMSSNELSEMLFKQEYRGKTEQEIANIADEDLRKRVEALSVQDKFQAATDKLSATFGDFVAGPIGSFLTSMQGIYTIVGLIATTITTRLITSIGMSAAAMGLFGTKAKQAATANIANAGASVVQSASAVPAVGWIAGIAGAIGLIATLTAAINAGDLFSPGQGGSGYGKRTLLAPEGAYKLNDNDNIIATTNPINVNDMISGPKGSIRPQAQTTQSQPVKSEISIAPANTQINLNLNGAAIGNANARQDYGVGRGSKTFGGAVDYSAPI